jgi:hypothetical protein
MHRYIDDAGVDISFPDLTNESRDAACDFYATRGDSRQHYLFEIRITFDDLVRNPA